MRGLSELVVAVSAGKGQAFTDHRQTTLQEFLVEGKADVKSLSLSLPERSQVT